MRYDSKTPVAVFLGPSLPTDQARAILTANYYPPARMGDIYRLLATNVRIIVIIDGLFHANIPVWQREILAALEAGITVVGAASMGALRAIELAPYGMVGIGEVYRWYEQELIEGDDEVALLHLDSKRNYYPLSEPLVNIRHTLQKASREGLLTPEEGATLQQQLKQLYYGDRTYAAIFDCAAFKALRDEQQVKLRDFIREQAESIKRLDSLEAIRYCVDCLDKPSVAAKAALKPGKTIERPVAVLNRGALTEQMRLLKIQDVLESADYDDAIRQCIVDEASQRFFLLQWLKSNGLEAPRDYLHAYTNSWRQRLGNADFDDWLVRNGLTHAELERELAARANADWLLEQIPPDCGFSKELASLRSSLPEFARRLTAAAFITDWAERSGIDVPETVLATASEELRSSFLARLQGFNFSDDVKKRLFELDYLARKITEKTPVFFGFDLWLVNIVFIRELQLRGEIEELARQLMPLEAHA